MKLCFMFIQSDYAKKVELFLSRQFDVKSTNYHGYDMLYVPGDDYKKAITDGIKFIIDNNIQNAYWVNTECRQMPINCIPLLCAEVPAFFKKNDFLRKIVASLCHMYAKKFEKRLNQHILIQYTPYDNVEFRLLRSDKAVENHQYYTEEITKYCLAYRHIFNYISVCDTFGKIITTINRNHSTEWPTKRPH